jgi:hypothetical protein
MAGWMIYKKAAGLEYSEPAAFLYKNKKENRLSCCAA